jgi:hypothetical protein
MTFNKNSIDQPIKGQSIGQDVILSPRGMEFEELRDAFVSTVGGSPLGVLRQSIENQKRSER